MNQPAFPPLIDPAELARHLADPGWVLVDCRFALSDPASGRRAYAAGHIPGACYAHLDEDLSGPIGPQTGRHPLPDPEQLAARLGAWGIDGETRVVAYDDTGGAFAVRLWWLLRWLGHCRGAILDGGLPLWQAQGGTITTEAPRRAPRTFLPRVDHAAWVSTDAVAEGIAGGRLQVVDARAGERFRGELEPIDRVAGHIPGAINLPFVGNLGADGRFLPPHRLRERFLAALGDTPPERVAHSCGSGVNACHNLLAMELAGLSGSRLYAGSWSEWIRDPQRPVACGA